MTVVRDAPALVDAADRAYRFGLMGVCVIIAGAIGYYWSVTEPRRKQIESRAGSNREDHGEVEGQVFPLL